MSENELCPQQLALELEPRNEYGYPVSAAATLEERTRAAQDYAKQARERNKPRCNCEACFLISMQGAVTRITENWPSH